MRFEKDGAFETTTEQKMKCVDLRNILLHAYKFAINCIVFMFSELDSMGSIQVN